MNEAIGLPLVQQSGRQPASQSRWNRLRSSVFFCVLVFVLMVGGLAGSLVWFRIVEDAVWGELMLGFAPIIIGFLSMILHGWGRPGASRGIWSVSWVVAGITAQVVAVGVLVKLGGAGLLVLLMSALPATFLGLPLVLMLALFGAALGKLVVSMGPVDALHSPRAY